MAHERDLRTEADLRALGFWFQLDGLVGSALAICGLGFLFTNTYRTDDKLIALMRLCVFAELVVLLAWFACGKLLSRLHPLSRVVVPILCLLWMLHLIAMQNSRPARLGPMPTAMVAYTFVSAALHLWVLITLFSLRVARVFTPEYRQLVKSTPGLHAKPTRSPFFVVYLLAHATAIVAIVARIAG